MIILAGPSGPKFIAEALVASEKVGEGGPGDCVCRRLGGETARGRSGRAEGIVDCYNRKSSGVGVGSVGVEVKREGDGGRSDTLEPGTRFVCTKAEIDAQLPKAHIPDPVISRL